MGRPRRRLCATRIVLCTSCVDIRTGPVSMAPMADALDLTQRNGLPEALRVLVDEYPRAGWQEDLGFAGLVAFWLDRHMMFRRLCEAIVRDAEATADGHMDLIQMQGRLSRYGGMLVQQLHGHHQIEDTHYFPVLSRRDSRLIRGFEILDKDHHALDGFLERFASSANDVLRAKAEPVAFREDVLGFQRFLQRHLEDEEDLIVPVILKYGQDGLG